jgi:hypothetical protein
MGCTAMDVLLKLMAGSAAEQDIIVAGELIVRQSTAPPREDAVCNYSYNLKKERKRKRSDSNTLGFTAGS